MRRDKRGRITRSINEEEMDQVRGWISQGVTDEKQLALQIMIHFPIQSQITATKYARKALDESLRTDESQE